MSSIEYLETDHVKLSDDGSKVIYLDQSLLPGQRIFRETDRAQEMYEAIKTLAVRGAPCIGIFAGYCLAVLAEGYCRAGLSAADILKHLENDADYLNSSRPTAVNLSYALDRVMKKAAGCGSVRAGDLVRDIRSEAVAIHLEDIEMCRRISEAGLGLLKDGDGILTHCNAGPLATSRYGTALGPILLGHERGMKFKVFANETRPLLQGARLTSYELYEAGVDVTLICDNMAATVMKQGKIQACLVGCDRVAANGDTANKIGTMGVAIMAKHFGIPFYVLGPVSSIDINCRDGNSISIEERDPSEIKEMFYSKPMAPDGVKCYDPAFDVTDHELITAIITDRGILRPPYTDSIAAILKG